MSWENLLKQQRINYVFMQIRYNVFPVLYTEQIQLDKLKKSRYNGIRWKNLAITVELYKTQEETCKEEIYVPCRFKQ